MTLPEELRAIVREEVTAVEDRLRGEARAVEDRLTRYLLEFRTEVTQQLADMNQRLSTIASTVNSLNLDARLPALSQAVIKLETRVYEHPSPMELKIAEIEARLRKLEGAT
jgi:uncharacterized protein YceH (UPF0502 family)